MIVKNESRILSRLLESVVPLIDSYCICDTGSTDNTVELIQDFFSHINIPGKIVTEPFKNFEYNRTFALNACRKIEEADYLLLLDADMVLQIDPSLNIQQFKKQLTHDVYHLFQGTSSYFYKNVRLVKNNDGIKYFGVTHEYFQPAIGSSVVTFPKNTLFIHDIGDGGSKHDKFIRDIALLKQGLLDQPNNERYVFYLANSYKDAGELDNAIETYKNRINMGGWVEEVWHSYYSIGKCYYLKKEFSLAISSWMDGFHFYPERLENLYEIIHHYRINREYSTAYSVYCLTDYAKKKKTTMDHLFLQYDVYDYKLDYELSLIAYYVNYMNHNIINTCMKVVASSTIDLPTLHNVLTNYKFYSIKMVEKGTSTELATDFDKNALKIESDFIGSTPTMCITENNHLIVIIRFVNYKIDDSGMHYDNKPQICTTNVFIEYDENRKKMREQVLQYDKKYDGVYVGVEDIRLLYSKSRGILYTGNRGISIGNIMIEYGTLDTINHKVSSKWLTKENKQPVEKNWVLFEKNGEILVIYKWFPLTIGKIRDNSSDKLIEYDHDDDDEFLTLDIIYEIDTPAFFRFVRGSTNGIWIQNEIWFLVHLVCHDDKRYYYHMIVTLNPFNYHITRYTPLFTFEGKSIEYALGFIYVKETENLVVGYSVMDRTTQFLNIKRELVEEMFIKCMDKTHLSDT